MDAQEHPPDIPSAAGAFSVQCKNRQHPNEDRYRIEEPLDDAKPARFFAVFDGHGGHNCSSFLEQHMHERVRASKSFGLDYEQALVDAVMSSEAQYHSIVHTKASSQSCAVHSEEGTSGSCAVCVLLVDDMLYVANVGDCRAIVSVNGNAKALTRDHKACDPDEKARVLEAGGFVRGNRMFGLIAVTRSLGDFEYKLGDIQGTLIATPETCREKITDEHGCLILGCDGVWDVVDNAAAVALVESELYNGADAESAAKSLVDLALDLGSKDDITVVVVPLTTTLISSSK